MDSELQKALDVYGWQSPPVGWSDDAIADLWFDLGLIVEAARKYADPLDELWWCENHGYRIDRFEGVTPENCLYEGRPGDCKPIAALIVRGITEAPDGR